MAKTTRNAASKTAAAKTAASAKPGTEAPEAQVDKIERIPHPILAVDENGDATAKIESAPDDFDRKVHLPLRRKDFVNDAAFFDFKAAEYTEKAAEFTSKAVEWRKLGSVKDRARAKRLRNMQAQMAKLREQLEADGIDVDDLLAD